MGNAPAGRTFCQECHREVCWGPTLFTVFINDLDQAVKFIHCTGRRRTGRGSTSRSSTDRRRNGPQPSGSRAAGCNYRRSPPGRHRTSSQPRARGAAGRNRRLCRSARCQTSRRPCGSGAAGCNRLQRRHHQRRSYGPESFFLQHNAGFLHARAPIFTFLLTIHGQEAGGTYVAAIEVLHQAIGLQMVSWVSGC